MKNQIFIKVLTLSFVLNKPILSKLSFPVTKNQIEERDTLLNINNLVWLDTLSKNYIQEIFTEDITANRIASNKNKEIEDKVRFWKKFIFIDFSFLKKPSEKKDELIKNTIYVKTIIDYYNSIKSYPDKEIEKINEWISRSTKANIISEVIIEHQKLQNLIKKEVELDTIKKQAILNINVTLAIAISLSLLLYKDKK